MGAGAAPCLGRPLDPLKGAWAPSGTWARAASVFLVAGPGVLGAAPRGRGWLVPAFCAACRPSESGLPCGRWGGCTLAERWLVWTDLRARPRGPFPGAWCQRPDPEQPKCPCVSDPVRQGHPHTRPALLCVSVLLCDGVRQTAVGDVACGAWRVGAGAWAGWRPLRAPRHLSLRPAAVSVLPTPEAPVFHQLLRSFPRPRARRGRDELRPGCCAFQQPSSHPALRPAPTPGPGPPPRACRLPPSRHSSAAPPWSLPTPHAHLTVRK